MGRCAQCLKDRDRDRTQPLRALYCSARWRALRARVLDLNPLCVECQAAGVTTIAREIDHILPHRGNLALFWRSENLVGLCSRCHVRKTRRGQ